MFALSWNCRGLNNSATIPYLCELVRAHRPNNIFLCETLSCSAKIDDIRARLRYDCDFTVNFIGRSGGLCVLWRASSCCNILSFSQNHIDLIVTEVGLSWRFTGFYSIPDQNHRRMSWDLLRSLANFNSLPWLCMGDFNDLLSIADKKGGAPHPSWLYRGFREAILDCNLSDLVLSGHSFTWSRGRGTPNFMEERLDRAMGNLGWHTCFPNARLLNLIAPASDHIPILLDCSPMVRETQLHRFRFENKWFEEPDLNAVIDSSWKGFRDFDLLKRVNATGGVLHDWGRYIALCWSHNKKDLEEKIYVL